MTPLQLTLASHDGINETVLLRHLASRYHVEIGQGIHVNGLPAGTWMITERKERP